MPNAHRLLSQLPAQDLNLDPPVATGALYHIELTGIGSLTWGWWPWGEVDERTIFAHKPDPGFVELKPQSTEQL